MAGLFLIALALAGLLVGLLVWSSDTLTGNRSEQSPVRFVKVQPVQWYEAATGSPELRSGYSLRYTYQAGGKTLEGASEENTRYTPGTQYKVCYNPANPKDHKLVASDFECGRVRIFD